MASLVPAARSSREMKPCEQSEPNLERLEAPSRRIHEILAEGRAALATVEASQWRALALTRWEMMRALQDYVDRKEQFVLAPIIAASRGPAAELARHLARANTNLITEYERFVERWALRSSASVNDTYVTEARKMADQIEEAVTVELAELGRLVAAHSSHTASDG